VLADTTPDGVVFDVMVGTVTVFIFDAINIALAELDAYIAVMAVLEAATAVMAVLEAATLFA
jgi:hypothetical protein